MGILQEKLTEKLRVSTKNGKFLNIKLIGKLRVSTKNGDSIVN
jgi:hypothetical protein